VENDIRETTNGTRIRSIDELKILLFVSAGLLFVISTGPTFPPCDSCFVLTSLVCNFFAGQLVHGTVARSGSIAFDRETHGL
jgi:hypothetical protein